jgi:sulfhydrogenase subunit beta (sulfur reductase)
VIDEVRGLADLPAGIEERQIPGGYRLEHHDHGLLFAFTVGPQSYKRSFFPPRLRLFRLQRAGAGFVADESAAEPVPRLALIGARSCDLHAIEIQDRVFLGGAFVDRDYASRREGTFVVAVQCGRAAETCFCTSMGTGPRATRGFDLALTELAAPHRFVVEVGSERGRALVEALGSGEAPSEDATAAERVSEETARSITRRIDTEGIRDLLYRNAEHPRWDDVAERCLSCTNCTLVCPTCFCATVEDVTDLTGDVAQRWRSWDSCFTLDHSYVHGGSVRRSTRARYRQWMTHKLASWIDQYGSSGCVGCGRCLTWCPVGIDLTEEVAAIRASDGARVPGDDS